MADFFPEDFGAAGDGKHFDTKPIQDAIDACFRNGGGRVLLGAGKTYLSGSLVLKSNVELHLCVGSVLLASGRLEDYISPGTVDDDGNRRSGTPVTRKPAYVFLYALDADGFTVSGRGCIDGNGTSFVRRVDQYYVTGDFYPRPTLIYTEHCKHITFTEITLRNVSFWSLHTAGCDDVSIDSIRILNPLDTANADGIDPDHCTNVRITNCHIECADDCICLKNTAGNSGYPPTKNVIISGCTLVSTSAAIKIGTEGVDDFENILVENCIITGSNRGISIQIRDQGNVRNVTFRDIIIETRRFSDSWWGAAEPVAITSYDRDSGTVSGCISNVRFYNITCKGENGILLSGEDGKIRDIGFRDVTVTLEKTSRWPKGRYDLRPGDGHDPFIETPSAAVYLNNVKNIRLENVRASIEEGKGFGFPLYINESSEIEGTVTEI